ncbi:MAG: hypothetical protein AB1505_08650 [Candidatus Latescibacterota bacterium]
MLVKLDVMREQMDDDRVYDVIDEWLEGVPLVTLLERTIDAEGPDDGAREADAALQAASRERAQQLVALQQNKSLASRLDLRAARELRDASDERRLQPLFVQRFFERAWARAGGTLRPDEHFPVWYVGPTPACLVDLGRERKASVPERLDVPVVFDKHLVSVAAHVRVPEGTTLLGPGHALFDGLIAWAIRQGRQPFAKGATLVDANLARPQRLWLVRSAVRDGRVETRRRLAHEQLSVVVQDHMGLRLTSPAYLLTCLPACERGPAPDLAARSDEDVLAWAYEEVTERQLARVRALRADECAVRRDYLNTAFTDRILELQGALNDLQHATLLGEDTSQEQARLRERIEELKARKVGRLHELNLMMSLSADLPDLVTQALVVLAPVAAVEREPRPAQGVPMRRDEEVEAIAMDVAMRFERSRGWTPADVSRDGEHYDVRSESPSSRRSPPKRGGPAGRTG